MWAVISSQVVWCQPVVLMLVAGREGGREGESVVICAALKKDVLGEKNSNRGEKGKEVHYLSIY